MVYKLNIFHIDAHGKESVYNTGDPGLIPGSGSSPGEGNGYPLQYSCLENPMDGGAVRTSGYNSWDCRSHLALALLIHIQ